MTKKNTVKNISRFLVLYLLTASFVFGQLPVKGISDAATPVNDNFDSRIAAYLIEVPPPVYGADAIVDTHAVDRVIASLNAAPRKNVVLIDDANLMRDGIVQQAAARLADDAAGRRLLSIDWHNLFTNAADQAALEQTFQGILKYVERSNGRIVLSVEDISQFSKESPLFGDAVSRELRS
ncbi:MAG TPA: hypothetical protein VK468_07915, partial [Pyrinomonadaceae bacterium]|nr:hypothetical protein [Pyrinomonadaceae bacterium]